MEVEHDRSEQESGAVCGGSSSRIYAAIDLKSFYASVETVERRLDPLTTNLVVADMERTEKTICLAVTPSLKAYGISGRARLFEVVQRVKEINCERLQHAPGNVFTGSSYDAAALKDPSLALDYIVATPRMALYMQYSTRIYSIYLNYLAPEDMHVYSVDEVFMDLTGYLQVYELSAHELVKKMIYDVLAKTGITATAGIGTNLYLCKIAMDIVAKHMEPDTQGVRIAELDEMRYRQLLWEHRPLTDFWRIGRGYARKLAKYGMYTMKDVALCSIGEQDSYYNEELLYRLFGVNAQLLIDHAWGWEPCTIAQIRAYRPENNSLSSGQVLQCPYTFEKARLVLQEMTDMLVLDLVGRGLVTDQMVLTIGYDVENLNTPQKRRAYRGEVTADHYGRLIPKHAHGTANLKAETSSSQLVTEAVLGLYDRIVNPKLSVRRITVAANHVTKEKAGAKKPVVYEQLDLFTDYEAVWRQRRQEEAAFAREKQIQHAMLDIRKKYGKNAILKGISLEEGATAMIRNSQIGGHRA